MDVDAEVIDAVDEAIAAVKKYKDRKQEEDYSPSEVDLHRESTVPLSVWFHFESRVRDHVDIKGSQMKPKHLTKGNCYDITHHNTVIINNGALNYTWAYSRVG